MKARHVLSEPMAAPALRRILWGIGKGLAVAAILSVWVLALEVLPGPSWFEENEIHLGIGIAVYALGGGVGGALVGLMLPLVRWKAGAVTVGVVAVLPVAALVTGTLGGFLPWTWVHSLITVSYSVAFGSLVGLGYRYLFMDEIRAGARAVRRARKRKRKAL